MSYRLPASFFTNEAGYPLCLHPPFYVLPQREAEIVIPGPVLDTLKLTKEGYVFPSDHTFLMEQAMVVADALKKEEEFALSYGSASIGEAVKRKWTDFLEAIEVIFGLCDEQLGQHLTLDEKEALGFEWAVEVPGPDYGYPEEVVPDDVEKFCGKARVRNVLLKHLDLDQLALLIFKFQDEGVYGEWKFEVAKPVYVERARAEAP